MKSLVRLFLEGDNGFVLPVRQTVTMPNEQFVFTIMKLPYEMEGLL